MEEKNKKKIQTILDAIEKVVMVIDVVILFFIAAVVFLQVILRNFGVVLTGTELLAQYSYVCFVFLAWPIAALKGSDISVMVIFDKFPKTVRKVLLIIFHVVMACFAAIVFRSALINAQNGMNTQSPGLKWFHVGWLYIVVSVGAFMTIIFNLIRAYRLGRGIETYKTESERDAEMVEQSLREKEITA